MSILVICPTRARPERAKETFEAFLETKTMGTTAMIFVVDPDDPARDRYDGALPISVIPSEGRGMGAPLNAAASKYMGSYDVLGFVGDDHRFRTPGWDERIATALESPGIAYGNDLGQPDLPTQVFMSSSIVRAIGWMALPGANHLYLDDTWRELGQRAGCLRHLEDVIIEHMHPVYGKAPTDEGYQRVNHPSIYGHDGQLYARWLESGQADRDAATVRALL